MNNKNDNENIKEINFSNINYINKQNNDINFINENSQNDEDLEDAEDSEDAELINENIENDEDAEDSEDAEDAEDAEDSELINENFDNNESNNLKEINNSINEDNTNSIEGSNEELKVIINEEKEDENEIKSIVFSNNNIENIVFNNNSDQNNILEFITGNQNIEIEEEVAIKNDSILYKDDIVYLKELENQLLSEYPVTKQSIKFIQKEVEEVAKRLIEVKNLGVKNYEMLKQDIEYQFINDVLNDNFNSKYIIPIVLDKHKIYSKLKEDHDESHENNDDSNIYFSESLENKDGIIEENQRTQMTTLKTLFHEKTLNKIDYKSYLNQESNIIASHIPQFNKNNGKNVGFLKSPLKNTLVLRYYDLKNIYWNTYQIKNDFVTSKDIYDEAGKIKGIENDILVKGDEINIVGFMILSQNKILKIDDDHEDSCKMYCYYNDLHKYFKRIGIITKIYNSSSSILIECKNHGLTNHEIIYINDTNSFPRINSTYGKSIKIIDKNIIEIESNIKFVQNGDYGILYSLSKLEFDIYEIIKENNNIKFKFKESTYKDEELNNNHNKIYLFDNTPINKTDYENIIKTILPNLDEIIENKMTELKKSYTFNDVNSILKNNFININNLHYQQINIIKDIFNKNLSNIINKLNNEKSNNVKKNGTNYNINNRSNKKYFKDLEYFLSDKFITDKNVEFVYGKYIHIGKHEDNLYLRLQWIDKQKDNGQYYYLNYLLLNYDSKNSNKEYNYISEKNKSMEVLYKKLEQSLKKEYNINQKNKSHSLYKFQAYIVTEFDEEDNFKNLKKILEDNSVVFYKNDLMLWKGKMTKFENLEDNTLALVGHDIWVWKDGSWSKSNAKSNYDNIKIVCELNNLSLKDIKLDSLDCIYRKDFGCQSKIYVRLQENILKIGETLNNLKKMNEYIDNEGDLNYIKTNIENIKKKYYSSIFDDSYKNKLNNFYESDAKNENQTQNNNKKSKDKPDPIDILLNLILRLENYNDRLHYIYDILDKDALLVGDKIYSKKYKKIINICSHYFYFKKIDYANNPDEKTELIDKMLSVYSDNGETSMNVHTCKVCGDFLLTTEYDDTEGFSSTGMIKKSRDVWISEKVVETNNGENIDLIDYVSTSNLEDKGFKELLLKYGLSIEDVDEAINILVFIVKNLYSKTGVSLPNRELINIIIDSMQKIKVIIPYSIYRIKEIKKLQDKGFSKIDIEKIDEKNTFKTGYDRFFKIKKNSILIARFLISVQTAIPSVVRSSKSTICPFYSFDDDEGINYMTCILSEMNIVLLKDKSKTEEVIKLSIIDSYNDFKNLSYIKELFNKKKLYDITEFKKLDSVIFKNEEQLEKNNSIIPEINENFNSLISNAKNIDKVKNLYTMLNSRLNYLAKSIKSIVKSVIASSAISNTYSGLVELSCCTEDADKFLDYYFYIATETDLPINNHITESNIIYNFKKYFVSVGSIHRFILYSPERFDGICNNIIVDNEINTSEKLIKKVFEIFVDTGIYAGTLREYIGNNENSIDIKSGLTKEEILSKGYSIEEYQKLLRNIEKHNTKYYNPDKKVYISTSELNKLKKDSNLYLDKELNQLVKNIANVLNKDKDFIQKYVDILRNFGIFENTTNLNINSDKEKIKKRELLNKKRLDYLKKFYIIKFKKYLSIIKNGNNKMNSDINLSFIDSDDIELELQNDIYNENKKLFPFLTEDVRQYFLNIIPEYSNEIINSINGIDNIYNSSYEKIKVYSDFNFNDASNVLLHIILSQFNNLILCSIEINSNSNEDVNINTDSIYAKNLSTTKCKYICLFILLLFEDLENDNELFINCIDGVNRIKNSLIHDQIDYKSKMYFKEDNDYISKMIKNSFYTKSMIINELEESIEDTVVIEDIESKYKEESEYIISKGKEHYLKKYGYLPTDDQLETYKSEYLENHHEDKMIEEEVYDLIDSTAKGEDVIDQGADYGGFNEYDFEDGDGFNYAEESYEE
jgi:hypothetical protein